MDGELPTTTQHILALFVTSKALSSALVLVSAREGCGRRLVVAVGDPVERINQGEGDR